MSAPHSTFDVNEDGVAVFTLNRPEKMNAISQHIFDVDLPTMIDRAEKDDSIRALVLAGAGGNFCSGADVTRMQKSDGGPVESRASGLRDTLGVIYRIVNLPKPVISAVDGIAFGGGFSLAMTADIMLATPRALLLGIWADWPDPRYGHRLHAAARDWGAAGQGIGIHRAVVRG